MNWNVYSPQRSSWSVAAPRGGREWSGAPSQRTAYGLARSLAGIDVMLARINRPALTVVPEPRRPQRRAYGFGPVVARQST